MLARVVLGAALCGCGTRGLGEDGYRLWLRYEPLPKPLDPAVAAWWKAKADEIYALT